MESTSASYNFSFLIWNESDVNNYLMELLQERNLTMNMKYVAQDM